MLLVDNEAFALVRARRAAAAAESGAAIFEHFRNDSADDAAALVTSAVPSARLLLRRDVSPETSNQWVLWYRMT